MAKTTEKGPASKNDKNSFIAFKLVVMMWLSAIKCSCSQTGIASRFGGRDELIHNRGEIRGNNNDLSESKRHIGSVQETQF